MWNVVTGATGYTGKYVAQELLSSGEKVKTLTGHPHRPSPFGNQVPAFPFNFDNPDALTESLKGAKVVFNTYWVRFVHGKTTFDSAVENTEILIRAARSAGVHKFVHVSIANPSEDSPLPYYRGKAILEKELLQSGLSYAVVRPTVIFGKEDIHINNIAWCLRRFPIFALPGDGTYRIQPVFVEDMAQIMVRAAQSQDNLVIDAVGPEIFSFKEFVQLVAQKIRSRAQVVCLPAGAAHLLSSIIGLFVKDVVLTKEEAQGLLANLLVSSQTPTGWTRFSEWLENNAASIGKHYASELGRHYFA